jgi:hypothetical protein
MIFKNKKYYFKIKKPKYLQNFKPCNKANLEVNGLVVVVK